MKIRQLFLALMCFVGLILVSCKSKNPVETESAQTSSNSPLANTKWEGSVMLTNLLVSFTTDECYIQASGYSDGVAVGTYKTNQSDLYVTITKTSGSFDSQLKEGDILIGTFDLNAKKITLTMTLYGEKQTIELRMQEKSPLQPDPSDPTASYSELIIGTWLCTKVYEKVDGEDDMEDTYLLLTMSADKSYVVKLYEGHAGLKGTWTLEGAQLTLSGDMERKCTIQKLTQTEMTARTIEPQGYEEFYFYRQ